MVIPIIICALRTVNEGLAQGRENLEIRGRVDTIQTTALLRSARGVLKTGCHSNSSEKPSANAGVKNSKIIIIIIMIKGSEKRVEYIDLARELIKLPILRVTMISTVIGAPQTVP